MLPRLPADLPQAQGRIAIRGMRPIGTTGNQQKLSSRCAKNIPLSSQAKSAL